MFLYVYFCLSLSYLNIVLGDILSVAFRRFHFRLVVNSHVIFLTNQMQEQNQLSCVLTFFPAFGAGCRLLLRYDWLIFFWSAVFI